MIFPQPKGPLEEGWYSIDFGELLTGTIASVAASTVHLTFIPPAVPTPLVVTNTQLAADASGRAGYSVAFYVTGGDAGAAYLLTASALTAAGGKRYVSAVLQVA